MKITEVRDGFIKIAADENVYLSSFVRVSGMDKDYIAQINSLKKVNNISIAYAKILFIMRDELLYNYDNTEPEPGAEIKPFTLSILNNSINAKKPVIAGKTLDYSGNIVIDLSAFNKKMLISVDDINLNNLLVSNFKKQFENLGLNTVIIDTNKTVKSQKYIAGKDFKLPLSKVSVQYLYKVCMAEATPDSRQMIAGVFDDISEYFDSVPFVPFGVFKSVVDDMVNKQHIFKLFVLKNKLSLLNKLGYFAENTSETDSLNKILEAENPVIDISSLDPAFQNYYLEYIYSKINADKCQVLMETSNIVSKKNLKMVIKESDIPTTLIVSPKYRYLNDIKSMFDNFIIEPTFENRSVFSVCSSFLSSMQKGTYLIMGEGINYIPVISKAVVIDDVVSPVVEQEDEKEENLQGYDVPQEDKPDYEENQPEEEYDSVETQSEEESFKEEESIEVSAEVENEQEEVLSKDEIIANIEQKSDELIDSLSEDTEEIKSTELFTDEEENDTTDNQSDSDNIILEDESDEEDDDVIEPEYNEITEESDINDDIIPLSSDDVIEDIQETENTELNVPDTISETVEHSLPESTDNDEIDITEPEDLNLNTIDIIDTEQNSGLDSDNETLSEIAMEPLDDEISLVDELSSDLDITETDNIEEISDFDSGFEEIASEKSIDNSESDSEELSLADLKSDDDDITDELEGFIELDPDESSENDIIIDISDDENINIDETIDRQIVEDVDKVYTTIKESDDDDISDSDLDLIDELNSDDEDNILIEDYSGDILEQPQESIIPEKQPEEKSPEILEKRDSDTPIVPVYDADIPKEDLVISDSIQQGDSVVHAKYGNGIVEKMIKYGTKTLFSINFEDIGRRLLDPTLTEIKKM